MRCHQILFAFALVAISACHASPVGDSQVDTKTKRNNDKLIDLPILNNLNLDLLADHEETYFVESPSKRSGDSLIALPILNNANLDLIADHENTYYVEKSPNKRSADTDVKSVTKSKRSNDTLLNIPLLNNLNIDLLADHEGTIYYLIKGSGSTTPSNTKPSHPKPSNATSSSATSSSSASSSGKSSGGLLGGLLKKRHTKRRLPSDMGLQRRRLVRISSSNAASAM